MNLTWLHVGVLYAIGVAGARRFGVALPRRVALLFYMLVLLFMRAPLTQDVTMIPVDTIRLTPPWSEIRAPNRAPVTKYEVANSNLHDVPMQIVPWMHQVRESWKRLEVPLWDSSAASGYPLLANGQSTPLSPLRIATLPLSLNRAMAAEGALKLLLALTLTFLFCATRYSPFASVVAAIVFGFSTWMTTWLQFPIAVAAAFLPGVMMAIEKLIDAPTRRRFLFATFIFATTVLSGHPETVFHIGLFAAAFGVWTAVVERKTERVWTRARRLLPVAGASAAAALLASPFLVPFAEAVVRSQRFAEASAPRDSVVPPYSDFASAVLLFQPRFFGHLPIERPWGPASLESICGFAGVFAMSAAIAVAIFIVWRRRHRERELLYVLGVVASAAIVLGWPGITEAFHAVAGLAPPMRMRLGICWFGAMLVAAAIDWTRRESRVPLLVGTLAVSATAWWLLDRIAFPTPSHRVTAVLSLLPSLGVLFALAMPLVRLHAAAVLTVVELWLAIGYWNPSLHPRELYPRTPLIAKLEQLAAREREPFRILGVGGQLYPVTTAMYGFEDVRPHDPMAFNRYVNFLAATARWQPHEYYAKWTDASLPVVDFLNVRYVIADRELPNGGQAGSPLLRLEYAGVDGRIYRNDSALPRFFAVRNVLLGADPATHSDYRYTALVERLPRSVRNELTAPWSTRDTTVIVKRAGNASYRLEIDAPRTTLIASSIPNVPGWRVPFPKVEVNGAFVGFVVPAGRHSVVVAYRPLSFYASSAIALLTLATLLALSRRRRADRPR